MAETADALLAKPAPSVMPILKKDVWKWFGDREFLIFAILVTSLVYAVELGSFTLSIDEEVYSFPQTDDAVSWLEQARWGMALLCLFTPSFGALPFVATFLFVLGLAAAATMFAGVLTRRRLEAFAFVALFVSSPIWLHIAEFNSLSWGLGVGLAVTALAAAFVLSGGLANAIIGGLLVAFSLGVYQSLILVFLVVTGLASTPSHAFCGRAKTWKWSRIRNVAISTVVGFAAYFVINWLALTATGIQLAYLDTYLVSIDYTSQAEITGTLNRLGGFVFGTEPTFLGWGAAILLLPWIGFLSGLATSFMSGPRSILERVLGVGAIVIAALIAFSPVFLSGGRIPTRVLVAVPLLYAILGANAFRKTALAITWPQQIALAYAVLIGIWISTALFYSDALARERDSVLATRLIERTEKAGRARFGEYIPIVVVGRWKHDASGPARHVEVFGTSFFEHDEGNPFRIGLYLQLKSGLGYLGQSIKTVKPLMRQVEQMPSWPADGSVALVGDVVVIKFGDPTDPQKTALE